jgi:prevent-host-death family protein
MIPTFDMRRVWFSPLSEVKASLSEKVRQVRGIACRLVITTNGRPSAVLLSYEDFLALVSGAQSAEPAAVIDLGDWETGRSRRRQVRDSVLRRFDVGTLSKKGQKAYKRDIVGGLRR